MRSDNFNATIEADTVTLIDCWPSWCGACAEFDLIYKKASERHPEHTFGKMDIHAEKNLVKELGIEHISSLLIYREGILLFRQPAYYTKDQLEDIVQQAESLNMNEVHIYIDAERQNENSN